jgi:hypothetical protein
MFLDTSKITIGKTHTYEEFKEDYRVGVATDRGIHNDSKLIL